jgi:hypothetical protein
MTSGFILNVNRNQTNSLFYFIQVVKSTPLHYQKIIVALFETDRLMKEIDKIDL